MCSVDQICHYCRCGFDPSRPTSRSTAAVDKAIAPGPKSISGPPTAARRSGRCVMAESRARSERWHRHRAAVHQADARFRALCRYVDRAMHADMLRRCPGPGRRWCRSFGAESRGAAASGRAGRSATPVLFLDTRSISRNAGLSRHARRAARPDRSARLTPRSAVLEKKDENGLRWSWDPDGCCEIRKVVPLAARDGRVRRLDHRAQGLPVVHPRGAARGSKSTDRRRRPAEDQPAGQLDTRQIEAWFDTHDLPRHPLGAAIPRSAARRAPAKSPRAKTPLGPLERLGQIECGIHVPVDEANLPSF